MYITTLSLALALDRVGGQRHASTALSRARPGAHSMGSWVGPNAGLTLCGKSHPYRNLIPGPSSPQPVSTPTTLLQSTRKVPGMSNIAQVRNGYHVVKCPYIEI